jgi:hypothetical protein
LDKIYRTWYFSESNIYSDPTLSIIINKSDDLIRYSFNNEDGGTFRYNLVRVPLQGSTTRFIAKPRGKDFIMHQYEYDPVRDELIEISDIYDPNYPNDNTKTVKMVAVYTTSPPTTPPNTTPNTTPPNTTPPTSLLDKIYRTWNFSESNIYSDPTLSIIINKSDDLITYYINNKDGTPLTFRYNLVRVPLQGSTTKFIAKPRGKDFIIHQYEYDPVRDELIEISDVYDPNDKTKTVKMVAVYK